MFGVSRLVRRYISDLVFSLIKAIFRQKAPLLDSKLFVRADKISCDYRLIGIRPSIDDLAKSLSCQARRFKMVGFNGFTEILPPGVFDEDASRVIHGRKLSSGEIGCARSHHLAYSLPSESEWTIFLEDDVKVLGDLLEVEERLSRLSLIPTIAALEFGSKNDVRLPFWNKKHGTYAYAVNRAALSLISDTYSEIFCVADWPIQWIYQMQFVIIFQTAVQLDQEVESLIDKERKLERVEPRLGPIQKEGLNLGIHHVDSNLSNALSIYSLYKLLKRKGVANPAWTAFLASKSEFYSG